MSRLVWSRQNYEVGVDQGVFFPAGKLAEPWNGLISVEEKVADLRTQVRYQDGVKYANRSSSGSFEATIQAYTYPDSFPDEHLTTRRGKEFGFSYRVTTAKGYKTHLVYNAIAKMNGRSYTQSSATPFSFDISTRPVGVPNLKPSAHLVIDTSVAWPEVMSVFEDVLYGSVSSSARLPLPDEIISIFEVNARYRVVDNGDGTFTITAPDEDVEMLSATMFQSYWPEAVYVDDAYTIHSF